MNYWSLSNLREPTDSFQVSDSVSSMCVSPESGTLLFGDDNGNLFTSPQASGTQRRRQTKKIEAMKDGESVGHYGMITALSTKQSRGSAASAAADAGVAKGFVRGAAGLVLSAGVDWTVKLWAPAYQDTPLTSFVSHSYDYMSDVQWSPSNSALFATSSSNGTVDLWNLALSLDSPMTGSEGVSVSSGQGLADIEKGINRISWSLDGRRLAAGASDKLYILTLSDAALRNSKTEEDCKSMMNQFISRGWISGRI